MKKDKYSWLVIIAIITIVIVANYYIYQMIPSDKKWLFWLMSR